MTVTKAKLELLTPYRSRIDALDDKIVDLMVERIEVIREVAELKMKEGIPAILEDRIREVVDRAGARAGTDEDMIREIYIMLVAVCCDLEEQIIDELPPLREREGQFDDDEDDDEDEDEEDDE